MNISLPNILAGLRIEAKIDSVRLIRISLSHDPSILFWMAERNAIYLQANCARALLTSFPIGAFCLMVSSPSGGSPYRL
jgi:hypothetical protein